MYNFYRARREDIDPGMTTKSERVQRPTDRATSVPHTPTPATLLLGRDGDHFVPKSAARVLTAPGDGSCLFHALIFGLHAHVGAPPTTSSRENKFSSARRRTRASFEAVMPCECWSRPARPLPRAPCARARVAARALLRPRPVPGLLPRGASSTTRWRRAPRLAARRAPRSGPRRGR